MKVVREKLVGPVLVASPFTVLNSHQCRQRRRVRPEYQHLDPRRFKAHALDRESRAGAVWINLCDVFDASLPFSRLTGGPAQGREIGGPRPYDAYTKVQAITAQL